MVGAIKASLSGVYELGFLIGILARKKINVSYIGTRFRASYLL